MTAGSLTWFANHELRLAWRDFLSMMTAGRRGRERVVAIALVVFIVFAHLLAWYFVARYVNVGTEPDKPPLVVITGTVLLSWSLLMSQAMESVTRAFYSRSDLDLILSSPAAARKIFAVRIGAMALSVILMAALLGAPIINVAIARGGARWLGAYGVVIAMGATAAACAVALTVALFRTIGPKRTRLAAQIVAAVIAAVFIIGLQVAAILSHGSLSRMMFLESDTLVALVPETDSLLWLPARAVLGDLSALAIVLGGSLALLGLTILVFSARFGDHAVAASSVTVTGARQAVRSAFRARSPARVLRQKEWTLLLRDPWLVSQTLMQLLYLLPPALLLWRSYGQGTGALVVLVPVLVMAAGQLAGGLAWLAISGEDAPDLVATAPVLAQNIVRAKIEAVLGGIGLAFAPFIGALAFLSAYHALIAALGVLAAAAAATSIQFWFRKQATRRYFRHRQTASRFATFAEAFSSISWAATAALATGGSWAAFFPAAIGVGILVAARWMSPHKA
ncbi:MAG: type transport system permease protein [Hyphomicrobiales bacterium]|nr:type transport system permease protein [Hyphomicrobiales bacterium]